MTPRRLALAVAAGVVAVDQITKWWVVATLPGAPISVIGEVLVFRHVTNTGAAFSLLDGAGSFIAIVAIGAVVFIVSVVSLAGRTGETVALGLVLGGAVGNLVDRIFRGDGFLDGAVVDWIDFSFFPAFNAADSAITIGAALALLFAFVER